MHAFSIRNLKYCAQYPLGLGTKKVVKSFVWLFVSWVDTGSSTKISLLRLEWVLPLDCPTYPSLRTVILPQCPPFNQASSTVCCDPLMSHNAPACWKWSWITVHWKECPLTRGAPPGTCSLSTRSRRGSELVLLATRVGTVKVTGPNRWSRKCWMTGVACASSIGMLLN